MSRAFISCSAVSVTITATRLPVLGSAVRPVGRARRAGSGPVQKAQQVAEVPPHRCWCLAHPAGEESSSRLLIVAAPESPCSRARRTTCSVAKLCRGASGVRVPMRKGFAIDPHWAEAERQMLSDRADFLNAVRVPKHRNSGGNRLWSVTPLAADLQIGLSRSGQSSP